MIWQNYVMKMAKFNQPYKMQYAVNKENAIGVKEYIFHEDGTIDALKKFLESICRRQRGEDATTLMNLQDKAFKQCLACAKEMGLTVSGRCKLVVPTPPDDEDDDL